MRPGDSREACLDYAKQLRQRHLAAGLCASCSNPHLQGLTRCASCRQRAREASHRSYEKKIRLGLCIHCGKPGVVARSMCEACLEKTRVYSREHLSEKAERFRNAGLCINCGEPTVPGRKQCERHLLDNRMRSAELQRSRVAAGLCRACAQPRGIDGTTVYCRICANEINARTNKRYVAHPRPKKTPEQIAEEVRAYSASRRALLAEQGICCRCPEPSVPGRRRCQKHLDLALADTQARYNSRMALRVCQICGANTERGKRLCPACKLARKLSKRKARKAADTREAALSGA